MRLEPLAAPVLSLALLALPAPAAQGLTERASLSSTQTESTGPAGTAPGRGVAMSDDGRVVAFVSPAGDLVPGDVNGHPDAFVRDLDTDTTELVSVNTAGLQGNANVEGVHLSADGRYVMFTSLASNVVTFDTNGLNDVFLRDRVNGTTVLVSRTVTGVPGNSSSWGSYLSADGRYAVFTSAASNLVAGDTNGLPDVFRFDRVTGTVTLLSEVAGVRGDGFSYAAHISGNGRYCVYVTRSTNLAGSGLSPNDDILLKDLLLGTTTRLAPTGLFDQWNDDPLNPTVSDDGRYVAFESSASNIVAGDTNGELDVFLWDTSDSSVRVLSRAPNFQIGNDYSRDPQISRDGARVVFESEATNLVPGDTNSWQDVFVCEVATGAITRVSVRTNGDQANSLSGQPSISGNGGRTAFTSAASNLVVGDTNANFDVFTRLDGPLPSSFYCETDDNSLGCFSEVETVGAASVSAGSGFEVLAVSIRNNQFGLLLYSTTGAQQVPFGNQFLCVRPPIVRTGVQNSGGTPPPAVDCSGRFSFDFNAWVASGADASLTVGTTVWCQFWSRDPGFAPPNGTHLTQGISFVLAP